MTGLDDFSDMLCDINDGKLYSFCNMNMAISDNLKKTIIGYIETFIYIVDTLIKEQKYPHRHMHIDVYNYGTTKREQAIIRQCLSQNLLDNGIIQRENDADTLNEYEFTLDTKTEKSAIKENFDYYVIKL